MSVVSQMEMGRKCLNNVLKNGFHPTVLVVRMIMANMRILMDMGGVPKKRHQVLLMNFVKLFMRRLKSYSKLICTVL